MSEAVVFLASFPPIQSAIKIDGMGGARIQLDIPESEMGNFIKAMVWRGQRLKITIETLTELDDEAGKEPERRSSKAGRRRS